MGYSLLYYNIIIIIIKYHPQTIKCFIYGNLSNSVTSDGLSERIFRAASNAFSWCCLHVLGIEVAKKMPTSAQHLFNSILSGTSSQMVVVLVAACLTSVPSH